MPAPLDEKRTQIEELCRQFHVRRLDVFGSAIREDFDPDRSDVDFLVEFEAEPDGVTLAQYFDFRDALAELLGRPVDLVMAGAVRNRYIKAAIEATRQLVYVGTTWVGPHNSLGRAAASGERVMAKSMT